MKSKGIIALLAILVIVLGFMAFIFSSKIVVSPKTFEKEIVNIEKTSDSTEIKDIEDDLNKTDLDNLDTELSDIETELNSN